jgi:hypothetical protein
MNAPSAAATPLTLELIREINPGLRHLPGHSYVLQHLFEATQGFAESGHITLDELASMEFLEETERLRLGNAVFGLLSCCIVRALHPESKDDRDALERLTHEERIELSLVCGGATTVHFRETP